MDIGFLKLKFRNILKPFTEVVVNKYLSARRCTNFMYNSSILDGTVVEKKRWRGKNKDVND